MARGDVDGVIRGAGVADHHSVHERLNGLEARVEIVLLVTDDQRRDDERGTRCRLGRIGRPAASVVADVGLDGGCGRRGEAHVIGVDEEVCELSRATHEREGCGVGRGDREEVVGAGARIVLTECERPFVSRERCVVVDDENRLGRQLLERLQHAVVARSSGDRVGRACSLGDLSSGGVVADRDHEAAVASQVASPFDCALRDPGWPVDHDEHLPAERSVRSHLSHRRPRNGLA